MQPNKKLQECLDILQGKKAVTANPENIKFWSYHRIIPQIYQNLTKENRNHPLLHKMMKQHTYVILQQIHALTKIAKEFNKSKIPLMLLKGVILSKQLYGNYTSRHSSDLDIMVHKQDLTQAEQLLTTLGYTRIDPKVDLTRKQRTHYLKYHYHFIYINKETKIQVELHWQLFTAGLANKNITEEEIWNNTEKTDYYSHEIYTLNLHQQLLYLCIHSAISWWRRFKKVLDVWDFIQKNQHDINWSQLVILAKKWRMQRPLGMSILLMKELFSFPTPKEIAPLIKKDQKITWLTKQTLAELNYLKISNNAKIILGYYKAHLNSSLQARIRYTIYYMNYKIAALWENIKLPDAFFWGYYLIAPIQFLANLLGRKRCVE